LSNYLVKTRKEYELIFSSEISIEKKGTEPPLITELIEKEEKPKGGLDTNNAYNLKYKGKQARYQIKGFKMNQLDSLKITLQITAE